MFRALTVFAVLIVAVLSASADQTADTLLARVREFAGGDAKDCGGRSPGAISEPCLVRAFRDRAAAFWVSHANSTVQPAALAVAVAASGRVLTLTKNRSTDPLQEHECVTPAIVREFGRERLRCKEKYNPPFRAEELAFRVGGDVKPPQPAVPIKVDSKICELTPGKKLQVEFVIGEDGSVRMVDILDAPEKCDVPAVSAALQMVHFSPGTLQGAPIQTSWFTIIFRSSAETPPN
jgi:hypothetical protein